MSLTKTPRAVRQQLLDAALVRVAPGRPALFRCAGCGRAFVSAALEVDHIQPEVDSAPEQRSDVANLQLLCNPKGAPLAKSCHRQKTLRENKARAALNRPPVDWLQPALPGALTIAAGGAYALSWLDGPVTPGEWMGWCTAASAVALCTYLVQNAWHHRAPLEDDRPQPKPKVAPEPEVRPAGPKPLDKARVVEAVRDVVGAKGDVLIDLPNNDTIEIRYPGTSFPDHQDETRLEMLQKIAAKMGDRWLPHWDTEHDRVTMTRRPALPRLIHHPGFVEGRPWNILPIAPGVSFDLLVTSHVLIIGKTNAGKTALMRSLVAAACDSARRDDNVRLILVDPKQVEMLGFRTWQGVRDVVSDDEDLWEIAFTIEREMYRRLGLLKTRGIPFSRHPRWIIVIDEYEQYFKKMNRYWLSQAKDEDGKPLKKGGLRVPPPIDSIQSVLSMARRAGIHLIIGTQSPDATWFGGTGTRENMGGRATVGPVDAIRAKMMFDDSSWGRDIPEELKGRTTVQVGNAMPEEVQPWYVPDPLDAEGENTLEDWYTLLRVGMPEDLLPEVVLV